MSATSITVIYHTMSLTVLSCNFKLLKSPRCYNSKLSTVKLGD